MRMICRLVWRLKGRGSRRRAIGALRAFVKVGRDTRYPTYSDVIPVLRRALDRLPAKLRTESARRLAQPRVAALRAFLDAVSAEAGDLLF